MSGLQYARIRGVDVRFISLTSAPIAENRDTYRDFRVLKYRIIRRFGTFDYLKVNTNEGYGVIHLLYKGKYIPQRWLSENWKDIHQSPIVDIRFIRGGINGLGSYIVSQYLSNQRCSFIRYSWSWGWVYCGFVKYWKKITKEYFFKDAIGVWHKHLSGICIKLEGKYLKPPPDVRLVYYMQQTLSGGEIIQHLNPPPPRKKNKTIQRCDACKKGDIPGRYILGQAICYECYPYIKEV